jgi:ribosomal protein S27E
MSEIKHTTKCRYCGKILANYNSKPSYSEWGRTDAYGIFTCICCDDCYNDNHIYGYKKDRYEHDEPLDNPDGNFFDDTL